MTCDPKPAKRYRATQAEWNDIRDAFADERCWVCDEVWHELHHIVNRSHSGDDVIQNLAPLCSECHRRVEARDVEARILLRQAFLPSTYDYLLTKLQWRVGGFLERNYPASERAPV
jgi:5-methylcytosine-specific restriction endonuclease McrA